MNPVSQGHLNSCLLCDFFFAFYLFNLYLLIMLLQLSQFSPIALLHPAPSTPLGTPPIIVHVHGSCI